MSNSRGNDLIGGNARRLRFSAGVSGALVALVLGIAGGCGGGGGSGGGGFTSPGATTSTISPSLSTASIGTGISTASLPADGVSSAPITITLLDAKKNPIANAVATISATGTRNTIVISGLSNSKGVITATISSDLAQSETLTVSAATQGSTVAVTLATTMTVTFVPVSVGPNGSSISVSATSASTDSGNSVTVTATIKDDFGALVANQLVSFSVNSGASSVTLSAPSATTGSSGTASVTVSSTKAQTGVTVTATATPTAGGSTFTLATPAITFTPGNTVGMAFAGSPQITAGVPFTLTVQFVDAQANVTPSTNGQIVLALPSNCATPNAPAAAGAGAFGTQGLALWKTATMTATLADATGFSVGNQVTDGASASGTIGALNGTSIMFVVTAGTWAVPGGTIIDGASTTTYSGAVFTHGGVNPSLASAFVNTITVSQNGVAQFTGLVSDLAGTFQVGAVATGWNNVASSFTVAPNVATQLQFRYGTLSLGGGIAPIVSSYDCNLLDNPTTVVQAVGPANGTFSPTIEVFAADVFGNATSNLPGGTHPIQLSGNGLTLAGTGTVGATTATVNLNTSGVAVFNGVSTTTNAATNALCSVNATDLANGTLGTSAVTLGSTTSGSFEVVATGKACAVKLSAIPATMTARTATSITAQLVDSTGAGAAPTGGSTGTTAVSFNLVIYNSCGPVTFTTGNNFFPVTLSSGAATPINFTIASFQQDLMPGASNSFGVCTTGAIDHDTANTAFSLLNFVAPNAGIVMKPGPADHLTFAQVPGDGYPVGTVLPNVGNGQAITPGIQVQMLDLDGNKVSSSDTIQLALTGGAGGGKFTFGSQNSANITQAMSGGVATFSGASIAPAASATYTIHATDTTTVGVTATVAAGAPPTGDLTITVSPVTNTTVPAGFGTTFLSTTNPGKLVFLNQPQSTVVGDQITGSGNEIRVQVQDMFGHPILTAGTTVNVSGLPNTGLGTQGVGSMATGGGVLRANGASTALGMATALTDAQGVAHFPLGSVFYTGASDGIALIATGTTTVNAQVYTLNNARTNPFDLRPGVAEWEGAGGSTLLILNINNGATIQQGAPLSAAAPGVGVLGLQAYDADGNVSTVFNGTATAAVYQAGLPFFTVDGGLQITAPAALNGSGGQVIAPFVSGNALFPGLTLQGQVVSGNYLAGDFASYRIVLFISHFEDGYDGSSTSNFNLH